MSIQKVARSDDDLKSHLFKQVKFLGASCQIYDEGGKDEAIRIANALAIIFESRSNNVSLIRQLSLEDKMHFEVYDCGIVPVEREISPTEKTVSVNMLPSSLVGIKRRKGSATFFPLLDAPIQKINKGFDEWWNQEPVVRSKDNYFTRRLIVAEVRDTDGGAHVDSKINASYAHLREGSNLGCTRVTDGIFHFIPDLHLAALRQIAYEALNSLRDAGYS